MKLIKRKTKVIRIGGVRIGGNHPVAIQSMTKTKTSDINRTNEEIRKLENAGCEIVRLAVKDSQDARAFKKIRRSTRFPLVADIHFNWRLAIEAIDNGADKIRLNPGNIYKKEEIKNIVSALKQAKIPLRVGVNSGSVRDLNSARSSLADRLVKGALDYVKIIEDMNFYNIVISLKASSVLDTIEAYRKISKICDYPMHLGLTATGFPFQGAIKSSIAIGVLLLEGIGDTIRVSLTDQPVHEIRAAQSILESLGLRHFGPQIISCPTCGRCQVDLVKLVGDFEKKLTTYHLPLTTKSFKIAIMGCEVNGPGEAREADIGIAFGKKTGVLFRKGEIEKKVSYANSLGYLLNELKKRR